jgi:hypothetical protein
MLSQSGWVAKGSRCRSSDDTSACDSAEDDTA